MYFLPVVFLHLLLVKKTVNNNKKKHLLLGKVLCFKQKNKFIFFSLLLEKIFDVLKYSAFRQIDIWILINQPKSNCIHNFPIDCIYNCPTDCIYNFPIDCIYNFSIDCIHNFSIDCIYNFPIDFGWFNKNQNSIYLSVINRGINFWVLLNLKLNSNI